MSPLPFEVFSFRSVGDAVARALRVDQSPDCRIVNGRTVITFRRLGAARWPEAQQMEFAQRAAAVARAVLTDDPRRQLKRGATRAIVIAFKDAAVVQGCEVTARWECIVPGQR
ncbi:MAG: hypothetical protein ACJ79A_12190 [Gemmatimonadaceae bacterium]